MRRDFRYKRMFIYEDVFAENNELQRIESMDYDTRVFKVPKIYKVCVDNIFDNHELGYSDLGGLEEFKKLISKYEQCLTGFKSNDHMVFVGSGVSSLIGPVVEAILNLPENNKRKKIVLFSPDYPLFHSVVEYAGGEPIMIFSKRENNYLPTSEELLNILTKDVAAVLFSNPNNPTGKAYSEKWINELVRLSNEKNFFIISDEIYADMLYNRKNFAHISKVKKTYRNYIKLFGLSKDRPGTTGLRAGYCIGDSRLLESIFDIQMVRNFSGSILSDCVLHLDIALRYFKLSNEKCKQLEQFSESDIKNYYDTIEQNRILQKKSNQLIIAEFKKNRNIIDYIEPDGGNSVYFRYYKTLSPMGLLYEFIKKGLAIYPTDSFNMDPMREGSWVRMCVTQDIAFMKNCISKI